MPYPARSIWRIGLDSLECALRSQSEYAVLGIGQMRFLVKSWRRYGVLGWIPWSTRYSEYAVLGIGETRFLMKSWRRYAVSLKLDTAYWNKKRVSEDASDVVETRRCIIEVDTKTKYQSNDDSDYQSDKWMVYCHNSQAQETLKASIQRLPTLAALSQLERKIWKTKSNRVRQALAIGPTDKGC
ncbi:hypothetical protein Tco_0849572, partial [Tanacetum coccineum]